MAGLATNSSDSFSAKHPKLTKAGKETGKQLAPIAASFLLDYLVPEDSPYRKYVDGANELLSYAAPAWGFGMSGVNNAIEGNYKQAAVDAGLAGLSVKAPQVGVPLLFMKNAYDKVQSGEVEDARNREQLQKYTDNIHKLEDEVNFYQRQGIKGEQLVDALIPSIQQMSLSDAKMGEYLLNAVKSNFDVYDDNGNLVGVPLAIDSQYQKNLRKAAQQQQTATNEDTNTGGIIPTADAAEIPPNATPAVPNVVQQPQALSQLVNGGKIWTTGDASKAKSGVTWSMADPNSEQYQRLKASADFANSLNSYKNRADLSDAQKEQVAIADLIALGLK